MHFCPSHWRGRGFESHRDYLITLKEGDFICNRDCWLPISYLLYPGGAQKDYRHHGERMYIWSPTYVHYWLALLPCRTAFTPHKEKYYFNKPIEIKPKKCNEVNCMTGLGMLISEGGIVIRKSVRLMLFILYTITILASYTQTAEFTYSIRLVSFSLVE